MEWLTALFVLICTYCGWGLTIVRQNKAMNAERLGKWHRVLLPGWYILCLPGLIDRITVSKNVGKKEIPILQPFAVPVAVDKDGKPKPFDFADGVTAPADVKVWCQIGFPGDDKNPAWELGKNNDGDIIKAVYRYVYGAEDSKDFVASSIDDLTRPIIQRNTSDKALKEANIAGQVENELSSRRQMFIDKVGLWLLPKGWLTLGDIDLPEEVKRAREKVVTAEKAADARRTEAKGIRQAAEFIAKGVTDDGKTGNATGDDAVSVAEALRVQQRLKALDTLQGSNITLVEPSIGAGVAAMLDIAGQGKNRGKTKRSNP